MVDARSEAYTLELRPNLSHAPHYVVAHALRWAVVPLRWIQALWSLTDRVPGAVTMKLQDRAAHLVS